MTANYEQQETRLNCRCCGDSLTVGLQEPLVGTAPIVLVTCDNPVCPLEGYTFDTRDYADEDLAQYIGGAR